MEIAPKWGYGVVLGVGLVTGLAIAQYASAPEPAQADDEALRSRVDLSLAVHRALRPFAIAVDVNDAKVRLRGSVDDALERELAARVAGSIDGVRNVDNRLLIEPDRARWLSHTAMAGPGLDDRALALAVRAQLRWHRSTRAAAIEVSARHGQVVLRGEVDSLRERDVAERVAERTQGVQAVDNRIEVGGIGRGPALLGDLGRSLVDVWISTKVKSALLYESNVHGLDLRVRTSDGVVILGGVASSRTELDLASEIAAAVEGVRRVDTHYVEVMI